MRILGSIALLAGASLALTTPATALTLVNATGQTLTVKSPVQRTQQDVSAGQHFLIPATWGDARHVYLEAATADAAPACPGLEDRYGTVKVPAHWLGIGVQSDGTCNMLAQIPNQPPPPADPPAEDDPTSDDTGPPAPPEEPTSDGDNDDSSAAGDFPPRGNGTWVYDASFQDGPAGLPYVEPGLWREELGGYNQSAPPEHRIDQVFSYGGDLEMECRGGSDCTQDKMHVYYYPPTAQHASRSLLETGASGFVSTQAYVETPGANHVIPIFDGRFDAGGYLQQFTSLNEQQARTFADIFSRAVCADPAIPGVQLDLEPFDIGDPAQAWFYDQLAQNLAGENEALEAIFRCKTDRHPQGRFFSVFTFGNQITRELGEIFTRYGNGYVIISLYDLGPGSAGVASNPQDYRGYVANEINRTVSNSIAAGNVPFQLAIPAAASTKEFESYRGDASGYSQREYVEQALDALDASGVRQNESFLGVAVWGWSKFMAWPPHSNDVFEPGSPPADVLSVLRERL